MRSRASTKPYTISTMKAGSRRAARRARVRAATTPNRRRRRTPEVARAEILDAAEQVFAHAHPDQVGLKEVARAAGLSHALITHYFGTYAGLIEAVLERRIRAMRERLMEQLQAAELSPTTPTTPFAMLQTLFRDLDDPVQVRLTRWVLASERPAAIHAIALREPGVELVARQILSRIGLEGRADAQQRLELALLVGLSAVYGYALGKHALVGALGRQVTARLDHEVVTTIADMLDGYLRAQLRSLIAGS